METEEITLTDSVHHGRNIRHTRKRKGIQQEVLANNVNLSQQTVSRYESMQVIDDEMLTRFAAALEVPMESLKYREESMPIISFENNKFDNNDKATGIGSIGSGGDNSTNHFNPVEKIVELYERLLQTEKEKNESLEKRLTDLEKKFGDS